MKIIGSVREDLDKEKRVSVTPETVKRLVNLGFSVLLEKDYGDHLGISDEEYSNKGANLLNSTKEIFQKSDIILRVNCLSDSEISLIKNNSILMIECDKDYNANDYLKNFEDYKKYLRKK